MREDIIIALKSKFEGVNEKILGRIAEKLAKTVTKSEDVAPAVEGVTFQQILDSYGDSRATEAQQTAVRNYEHKYGLKDGKVIEGGEPIIETKQPKQNSDGTPDWVKALIDSNKALSERLDSLEKERTSTSRKQKFEAVTKSLPELYRKAYSRVSYQDMNDEKFEELLNEVKSEVQSINDGEKAKGVVFGRPSSIVSNKRNDSKEASEAETNAVVNKLNI